MEQEPSQHYGEMESGMDVFDDRFNENSKLKNSQHDQESQRAGGAGSGMYGAPAMQSSGIGASAMSVSDMEQHSAHGRQTEMSRLSYENEALPESPLFVLPNPNDQLAQIDLSPEAL